MMTGMRTSVSLVTVLAIMTGCSRQITAVGMGVGGLMTVPAIAQGDSGSELPSGEEMLAAAGVAVMLIAVVGGMIGGAIQPPQLDQDNRAAVARAAELDAEPVRNEVWRDAQKLTRTAQVAAKRGDCETVIRIEAEVKALDRGVHQLWFERDVAIAGCLEGR